MGSNRGAVLATVFAGLPPDRGVLTDFDARCGFACSADAVEARRAEDRAAAAEIGASTVHLRFPDGQYGTPTGLQQIAGALVRLGRDLQPLITVAPLGIGHPDHLLVGDAFAFAAKAIPSDLWVYEDLPYRVQHPEEVGDRLRGLAARGWDVMPAHVGGDPGAAKVAAVARYRSQVPLLPAWAWLVPERTWRLCRSR